MEDNKNITKKGINLTVVSGFIKLIETFHNETNYFSLTTKDKNKNLLNKLKADVGADVDGKVKKPDSTIFRLYFERFFSDFKFIFDGGKNGKDIDGDNIPLISKTSNVTGFESDSPKEYLANVNSFFSDLEIFHGYKENKEEENKVIKAIEASGSSMKGKKAIRLDLLEKVIEFSKLVVANPGSIEMYVSASDPMDHEMIFALAFTNIKDYTSNVYSLSDFGAKKITGKSGTVDNIYLPTTFAVVVEKSLREAKKETSDAFSKKIENSLTKINVTSDSLAGLYRMLDYQFSKRETYANRKISKVDRRSPIYYSKAVKYVQKDSVSQPKTDVEIPLFQIIKKNVNYVGALRISIKKSNAGGLEGGNLLAKVNDSSSLSASLNSFLAANSDKLIPSGKLGLTIRKKSTNDKTLYDQLGKDRDMVLALMELAMFGDKSTYIKDRDAVADVEANTFYDFGKVPSDLNNIGDLLRNAIFSPSKQRIPLNDEINKRLEDGLISASHSYTLKTTTSNSYLKLFQLKTTNGKEDMNPKEPILEVLINNSEDFIKAIGEMKSIITNDVNVSNARKTLIATQINQLIKDGSRYSHGNFKIKNTYVIAYIPGYAITFPVSSSAFKVSLFGENTYKTLKETLKKEWLKKTVDTRRKK